MAASGLAAMIGAAGRAAATAMAVVPVRDMTTTERTRKSRDNWAIERAMAAGSEAGDATAS